MCNLTLSIQIIKFSSCCHNSMAGIGFGFIQVMCNSNLSSPLTTTTLCNHCHDLHHEFLLVASTFHVDSLPSPMFYEESKKDHHLFNNCTQLKVAFLLSILWKYIVAYAKITHMYELSFVGVSLIWGNKT